MTCSPDRSVCLAANEVCARLLAMRAAVLRDGALDFSASGARPDRPRNCARSGDVVDADSDHWDRLTTKTGIVESSHAGDLRRGKFVWHRHPRRLLEHRFQWAPAFDVDGESRCGRPECNRRWRRLQLRPNAREGIVGYELRSRGAWAADREADDEWKQPHEIKTRLTQVQPVGGDA